MAHVLTQTYCYFCDAVAQTFTKCIGITESISKARAASALAQMGNYEQAKNVMMENKNES
jgi:hypothetical protein